MAVSIELLEHFVSDAFKNNKTDIIRAFVNTYNRNFDYEHIYDVMGRGEFGLEGFVKEGGVDLQDLGDILQTYLNDTRYHYCAYNGDGFYVHLQDVLSIYIDRVFECKECLNEFVSAARLYEIMDTTQSHNPELVKKINELWIKGDSTLWMHILYAIALRDRKELEDKGIRVLFAHDAYDLADRILMNVCDDADLEMIINYIRY